MTSPSSTPLESDEQGVLDAGSALKQYVRQQEGLIPERERQQWIHTASQYLLYFYYWSSITTGVLQLQYCQGYYYQYIPEVLPVVILQLQYHSISTTAVLVTVVVKMTILKYGTFSLSVIADERSRFSSYRRLLRQLPDDNRATLSALFGHFYM